VSRRFNRIALVALSLAIAGCAHTELTVLLGPRSVDGDSAPGGFLQLSRRFGRHGICSYVHTSDPTSGRPFNNRHDPNEDMAGCGFTWRGSH
jgi:hypothetical protein